MYLTHFIEVYLIRICCTSIAKDNCIEIILYFSLLNVGTYYSIEEKLLRVILSEGTYYYLCN